MQDTPSAAQASPSGPVSAPAATPAAQLLASPLQPAPPTALDLTPLAAIAPDTLTAYFEADPSTISDEDFRLLLLDLRRRRSAHLSEEAAKQARGKKDKPAPSLEPDGTRSPVAIANAALRDGPAEEITLDKLLG